MGHCKFLRLFYASENILHVRNRVSALLFILLFLTQSTESYASHIFGGELLYTYVSGNTYKVTLTVYGDCGASADIFNTLYTAAPVIYVSNGASLYTKLNLNGIELGTEVSPVCASQLPLTKCNGGTLPGVRRFVYSDTVIIPYKSANWSFIYRGEMGASSGAGRSSSITNIINVTPGTTSTTIIQLEADLNNTISNNSSPAYSTIPTPFYCVNVEEQYNHGAIDPDGDSLAFSLIPAIDANTGASVTYVSPFTASLPLSTDTGAFNFNTLNGQITFTPNETQDGLIVCQVSEYKGGVLVGTSEREMTFVVLDGCNGTPPELSLQNVSGGSITGKNIVNICAGTSHLSFGVAVSNPDGDSTIIISSTLPGSSTLSIANNNTPNPSINFDWGTASVPAGIYTFYLTVNNNHCPLANKQTIAYTINVTPLPTAVSKLLAPTQCVHQAYMQYTLYNGYTPRTVTIMQGSTILKTYIDSTGIVKDSLPKGNYTIYVSSDPLCYTSSMFYIPDSGKLPLLPDTLSYCVNAPASSVVIPPIGNDAIITWYNAEHYLMDYPPIPNTSVIGIQKWYYAEEYEYCQSDTVPVIADVHPLPVPVPVIPATICLGDTISLVATGGVTYTWTPQSEVLTDNKGNPYIRVMTPVTLQVNVTDQYGCTDSTLATYKDIQYCCNFIYPNAFTPNGDGKNDGFKVTFYGNLVQYHLIIYNRWGQQVFATEDPEQYWDGKFNGIPCDIGTYYYYFKGQCLTGNKEESKGDVILIR